MRYKFYDKARELGQLEEIALLDDDSFKERLKIERSSCIPLTTNSIHYCRLCEYEGPFEAQLPVFNGVTKLGLICPECRAGYIDGESQVWFDQTAKSDKS